MRRVLVVIFILTASCRGPGPSKAPPDTVSRSASSATSQVADVHWPAVDSAMGRPGVVQGADVHRFSFPRSDLHVVVAGTQIRPALALGGWVAMKSAPGGAIAMGDLVLTEDELNPVIGRLEPAGIELTAIHHHLLHESPRVYYMHVHGRGDAVKLATAISNAIAATKAPPPAPAAPPAALALDTSALAASLGYTGKSNGGVYQVSIPRAETIRDDDVELPPSMGVATAINFQPTAAGSAVVTGDFVLLANEVNSVITALNQSGIQVTSLHNHLLAETPRLFFMHFWGAGTATKLAAALHAALSQTNLKRPS